MAIKSLFSLAVSFLPNPGGRGDCSLWDWNAATWSLWPIALEWQVWTAPRLPYSCRYSVARDQATPSRCIAPCCFRVELSWRGSTCSHRFRSCGLVTRCKGRNDRGSIFPNVKMDASPRVSLILFNLSPYPPPVREKSRHFQTGGLTAI